MSMEPLPSTSNKPISLAKLATIFAAVFGIAFGLCTASVAGGGLGSQTVMTFLIGASAVTEGVCLLGLLAVGVWAIVRLFNSPSQR